MWYLFLLGVLLLPPDQSTHTLCCFCFPLPNYHSVLGVNVLFAWSVDIALICNYRLMIRPLSDLSRVKNVSTFFWFVVFPWTFPMRKSKTSIKKTKNNKQLDGNQALGYTLASIVPVKAGEVKNKHPVSAYLLFLIYTLSNNTHKKTLLWSKMRAWMVVTKATGSRGDTACRVADSHSRRQRRAALGGQLAKFTVCCNVETSPRISMWLWNLCWDEVMAPHLNKPLCCVSRTVYSSRITVTWWLMYQFCWLF